MARRPTPPDPQPSNLSFQQMEGAIPVIDRRITGLDSFDLDSIDKRFDPRISALQSTLDDFLISTFGSNTIEYNRYRHITDLDRAGLSIMGGETPIQVVREGLAEGIADAKTQLEAIKANFLEKLEDAGHTKTGKTLKAYEGLELHPAIDRASGQLYRDGYYANAIEDAVKALNGLVRLNSGIDDKDGTALMEFVFSPNNPVLKFNPLADPSDRDEQKGFMMMFSGAVAGLRNPRAHKLMVDDPEMALEFIAYISLLAKLADKTTK